MSKISTYTINMDSELMKEFDRVCESCGMSSTAAFNEFAKAVVREGRIPFEDRALEAFNALRQIAKANGIDDMSLEEIRKTRIGD